jgi:hypothetical protein
MSRREILRKISEEQETGVFGNYDVIVAGGGPAGVAAAISAARTGARTALFEVAGCLGGVWTAGMLAWIFDFDKDGITREIRERLDERDARVGTDPDQFVYDVEEMKLLLEEMCTEAGVYVQLHTRLVAAVRGSDRRLKAVMTESKSGRQAWLAKTFVDCTGDGDLGALAGCGFDYGHEETGQTQPMTLMALVNVRDADQLKLYLSFYNGDSRSESHRSATRAFKAELSRAGVESSYGNPTLFHIRGNLVAFMANHEYDACPYKAEDVTAATFRARREVFLLVRALNQVGGVWSGIQVVGTADQIGVRDGRRIHGRYRVSVEDIMSGARHDDGIARVKFNVDVHAFTKNTNDAEGPISTRAVVPYDVPIRALIAKDVDGLLMAGRCISGDYLAHASYRVTGAAVAMGDAAGTLAGLSALAEMLPHEMEWSDIRHHFASLAMEGCDY